MSLNEALLAELKHEIANTRKMLERVPSDRLFWKPHEKSMSLGRLASHIAELPIWLNMAIEQKELDGASNQYVRFNGESTEAIIKMFDERIDSGIKALRTATDETLDQMWTLRRGEQVIFQLKRKVVLRNLVFNHLIHHRGQLSVYLRLLDVPVPGMYGPSADEK